MAIEIKVTKSKDKTPKPRDVKAAKILTIASYVAVPVLILCSLSGFAGFLFAIPLIFVLLLMVIAPTAITIGLIWISEGFRNFIKKIADAISQVATGTSDLLQTIFPVIAVITMLIVIAGFVITLLSYRKNKEDKNYKRRFIIMSILLGIAVIFLIIGCVTVYVI